MEATYALNLDTLDYTIDELDDIADRKVGPIPVGGDSLARLTRARRGVARATGESDPYGATYERGTLWGAAATDWRSRDAVSDPSRRMAAVGRMFPPRPFGSHTVRGSSRTGLNTYSL